MNKYLLYFVLAIFIFSTVAICVYLVHVDEVSFAPDIFLTEVIKFIFLSLLGMFILDFYTKYNVENKKFKHVDLMIISNINEIKRGFEVGMIKNELTTKINLLVNNLGTLKIIYEFDPVMLSGVSRFEINMRSEGFKKHISNIEFHIDKNSDYRETNSFKLFVIELNDLLNVFRNY